MSKSNTLVITTPEGITFSHLLAGPVTRFAAWGIDLLCIFAVGSVFNIGLGLLNLISLDLAMALQTLLYFILTIGYGMVAEWFWRGQTLGKKLLRLRVVDAQGLRLEFSQIAIRNLLRFVDALPMFYLVGGIACLVSRRGQRLGDLAANTVVIRSPRLIEPDVEQIMAGKYNSLREYPHLAARLRQRVSPSEASLALQAILRRDRLDPAARLLLFGQLAEHFRDKVAFPGEATEGLTDEQYIRNVLDVIYRARSGQTAARQPALGQREDRVAHYDEQP
jgi:uncharacterized RDD family membrane protein YckC